MAQPSGDWSVFKQSGAEHWDGFPHAPPRSRPSDSDGLVAKMRAWGNPEQMGSVADRCLQCGQGTNRVAMRCQSSLGLRGAKVAVDNGGSQVSQRLHEGVLYRHSSLPGPAMLRTTCYQNAAVVFRAVMRCGAQCLDDFSSTVRR
jgi:hypothetical protein